MISVYTSHAVSEENNTIENVDGVSHKNHNNFK